MAKRVRFSDAHKEWLRNNLIRSCEEQFLMTHEAAVAAVTGTSVPMFVDVGRRIVHNCPQYEQTHTFTLDDARRAFGEWLAYKAGVRIEGPVGRESPVLDRPTVTVDENCNWHSESDETAADESGAADNTSDSNDIDTPHDNNDGAVESAEIAPETETTVVADPGKNSWPVENNVTENSVTDSAVTQDVAASDDIPIGV